MKLLDLLFPYRAHLEAEVEYLRGQLAQRERTIDELTQSLRKAASGPARREPRRPPNVAVSIATRGWDAYRARKGAEDTAAEQQIPDGKEEKDGTASE